MSEGSHDAAAEAPPTEEDTSWDLENVPAFHEPRLLRKIRLVVPNNEPLLSPSDILKLNTFACRDYTKQLAYRTNVGNTVDGGKTDFRNLSSSGSKIDMQRRIMTWHFTYARQLKGMTCLPHGYVPPPDFLPSPPDLNQKYARKRKPRSMPAIDLDGNASVEPVFGDRSNTPVLFEPNTEEIDDEKLERLLKAEQINKARRDSLGESMQHLRTLYETRRQIFDELEKLEQENNDEEDHGIVNAKGQPLIKRQRLGAEENSLHSIGEQIAATEARMLAISKRRML